MRKLIGAAMHEDWTAIRHFVDSVSALAIVGAIFGMLPSAAALGAAIWYIIQIYESRTFQHWINNARMKHRARKVARLKAKQKIIEAKLEATLMVRTAQRVARDKVAVASAAASVEKARAETEIVTSTLPK